MPTTYEKLSAITMVDLESELPFILAKDILETIFMRQDIFRDVADHELVKILDFAGVFIQNGEFDPL